MRIMRKLIHPAVGAAAVFVAMLTPFLPLADLRPATFEEICNEETVVVLSDGTKVPIREGEAKTATQSLPNGEEIEVLVWYYGGDHVGYSRNLDRVNRNLSLCKV